MASSGNTEELLKILKEKGIELKKRTEEKGKIVSENELLKILKPSQKVL